jgi:hypothetical protein
MKAGMIGGSQPVVHVVIDVLERRRSHADGVPQVGVSEHAEAGHDLGYLGAEGGHGQASRNRRLNWS